MMKRIKGFTLIELLIVVAIIAILAAIAVPNFLEAQTRSKVARVKADQRSLVNALESYYIDNNSYPAQASSEGTNGYSVNNLPGVTATGKKAPSFRVKKNNADPLCTLTTPVAFITSFSADPFADTRGATFNYSVAATSGAAWLLWSYGPDSDEQVDNPATFGGYKVGGNIKCYKPSGEVFPVVETLYYNPATMVPSNYLINATYDPSNGTTSRGDVYRRKE